MGWVSILKLLQLRNILGIPPHVIPVAYLCLGYPIECDSRPLLEKVGWRDRLPIEQLVHFDSWESTVPSEGWRQFHQSLSSPEEKDY